MNPRSWLALGLAVALSACGGGKQAPPPSIPAEQAKVDAIFAEYARPGSPGVAVGIYRGGKQIYSAGYGYADLASNVAITPHTPFQIASTSKQFAAFSAVLLERDGKLDLDADLRDYLPYVPDFGRKITPRHLIYHTSGLRDQWDLFLLGGRSMSDRLRQSQIVTMVKRQRGLNFAPGAGFEYSNTGYTLLAELVGAVSGQTLREFSDTRIFRPLGMRDTFFSDDLSEIIPNRAHSYEQRDGKWHLAPLNYETVGATGLYATVEDLLRWAANFTRPVVGDAALIREFSEMGKLDDGSAIPYGFGLKRMTFSGHEAVYHNGSDAAFRSQFAYFPEQDFAVVLLANNGMNLQPAFEKVIAAYLPAATTQNSLPALTTPEPSLVDALQGTYLTPGGSTVLLSKGAHGLVLQ
ncbi:serine hydrolase domain-containing protein, partial [Steroidobacter sp.]|uniref:serine hydrolase domain-containing protein n=1 Tax=Steroidobacter sp. TaxID=1978227 RepID=UPI001A3DC294